MNSYRDQIELARRANAARRAAMAPPERVVVPLTITPSGQPESASRQWDADSFLTHVDAQLVRSGEANRNGALWLDSDLEYGLPSLAHKPINFAHIPTRVCGVIEEARIELLEGTPNNVIRVRGQLWDWVQQDDVIDTRSWAAVDDAWCSMECIPNAVQCLGQNGCEETYDYMDVLMGECCIHILDRTATRRMVDPVFQGMGIILPPVQPGWHEAKLKVVEGGPTGADYWADACW